MNKNNICCVIVSYNIGKKIYKCYDSISKQVDRIIIVDNGSDKNTVNVLKELSKNKNTIIIFNDENLGIATALNQGAKIAIKENYKWLLTMDNDSIASNKMIENMILSYNELNSEEKQNIVSIFPNHIEEKFADDYNYYNEDKKEYIEYEITSGNLIKLDVLSKIGFWNENLFIDYVDYELCLRLSINDYKMLKVNNSILIHNLGNSVKKRFLNKTIIVGNHSFIRRYYITRNRLFIWKKYKKYNSLFVKNDKNKFVKEIFIILLYEEYKIKKIKMIIKGIKDYKINKYGKCN